MSFQSFQKLEINFSPILTFRNFSFYLLLSVQHRLLQQLTIKSHTSKFLEWQYCHSFPEMCAIGHSRERTGPLGRIRKAES